MKKIIFSVLLWASMLFYLNAQTFSDEKSFTFDVANLEVLRVHNKHGRVQVIGTNGRQAKLTVKRTIKAVNAQKLATAKKEIYLDSTYVNGELIFFMQHPDYKLEINEIGRAYYNSDYNNWNNKVHFKEKVEMVIELQVPQKTQLYISTHQKDLIIKDIEADVLAQNHHGHITLESIGGNVQAHTHHGSIKASMTKVPNRDASFDTHHGHIKVYYPSTLSAQCNLKTRHGSFYTDFDYHGLAMPVNFSKGKKGTKYKIGGGTGIKIGNGGPKLDFETYHGSVYILK